MIGLIETVERCANNSYRGRSYKFGSRVRMQTVSGRAQDVTVISSFLDDGSPAFDFVTQSGVEGFAYDSQIVQVILL